MYLVKIQCNCPMDPIGYATNLWAPSCRVPIFRNGKLKRGKLPTLPLWGISPKLTARTWKLMVGSDEFPLRMAHFQVRGRVEHTPENITKGWKILPLSHERKQRLMVYFYTPHIAG